MAKNSTIVWFDQIGMADVGRVGGKNASLGEMINHLAEAGVSVPGGFATTAAAYTDFLQKDGLDQKITAVLEGLDIEDLPALKKAANQVKQWILEQPLPVELERDIETAYAQLTEQAGSDFSVAVRSSATAEDLPEASFAGQQETYLNVRGLPQILESVKKVYASLYGERAIAYRVHQGFTHADVAISVGVQYMVRSDLAASGVAFSLDTESGFQDVVLITSSYGLGELVVQGAVNPDEFYVYKPNLKNNKPAVLRRTLGSKAQRMTYGNGAGETVMTSEVKASEQAQFSLSDSELEALARQVVLIEEHYGRPMDVEWAKDGSNGQLYILQARPETVKSHDDHQILERYRLEKQGQVLATGRSIGQRIGQGTAKVIQSVDDMDRVEAGDVLITEMTDPDWEPIMARAAAIVTNRGGRTCHAAIIARELGVPAIVGTGDATKQINDGDAVTISCAEGDEGYVYEGLLPFHIDRIDVGNMPDLPLKVMLNVGNPDRAFSLRNVPNSGVGLARIEFVISNSIGIHPQALLNYDSLPNDVKQQIDEKCAGYASPTEFYIAKLCEGIATLAAAFAPQKVIVRLSDFKSNEYANLIGGHLYEPHEENPMIGFRGASRYVAPEFSEAFSLECEAVKRARDEMGLTNIEIMIPFVRTVSEAAQVIQVLKDNGLERTKNDLRIIMMCEVPSNALLAEQFLEHFDGFSIGSNDLTQLTLGLDRDSALIAEQFDERNDAVKVLLRQAITACKNSGKYVGICGQGPSDHQDFAKWLMDVGIESVSLNPDSVVETCLHLAKHS